MKTKVITKMVYMDLYDDVHRIRLSKKYDDGNEFVYHMFAPFTNDDDEELADFLDLANSLVESDNALYKRVLINRRDWMVIRVE